MNLLTFFILLSIVNVIGGTIKSLITVNGNKWSASLVNALYFGFYTIVIIYINCDLLLWEKVLITAICNFIGVFIVKVIEEKTAKEKLWKIEMAVPLSNNLYLDEKEMLANEVKEAIEAFNIPCNYQTAGKWLIYNCYCSTKKDTKIMKNLAKNLHAKISAYESMPMGL